LGQAGGIIAGRPDALGERAGDKNTLFLPAREFANLAVAEVPQADAAQAFFDGGAVGLETTTVLASNGALHDTVLAALR
jgi:hypothetical protein